MRATCRVAGMARSYKSPVGGRHAGDLPCRGHGPLLQKPCRRPPCGRHFALWNQKGTDTGSLLFAGMARSYRSKPCRFASRY